MCRDITLRRLWGYLLLILMLAVAGAAQAQRSGVTSHGRAAGLSISIPINKSDVLRAARPFHEVAVGNPDIADVQVLGANSLYVFGKKFGSTSVTLSDKEGAIIAVVDVNVVHDVARLKRMLHTLMPRERIAVRAANDGIVLSGTVSSSVAAKNAMTIAERYAPGTVANLMSVAGSQQVMLAVRFVEMRRDAVKKLGIKSLSSVSAGAATIVGEIASTVLSASSAGRLGVTLASGATSISGFIEALEGKGLVRILAEPTLVAMSGDSAEFLAGGEFPVPVGAKDGEVKIEFKNFGVGLSFTPTVLADQRMNIRLSMEVSEPDETRDFEVVGVKIPGLVVRRAKTAVELRNGESFAIAGLLTESFTNQVDQLPFISDLPIIGALTRSTSYRKGQSELVMIVTPYLVAPVQAGRLREPGFRPPSERELFLGGHIEKKRKIERSLHNSAGFSGPHGYSSW